MNEPMATLSRLPPATWFLVAAAVVLGWGLSWAWRWYRRRRAQKALVAAVCYNVRFYPLCLEVKEWIASGRLARGGKCLAGSSRPGQRRVVARRPRGCLIRCARLALMRG